MPDEWVRLQPPGNVPVEVWLSRYDNQPHLLPRWPKSEAYVLIAMRLDAPEGEVEAIALLTPQAARMYASDTPQFPIRAHGYFLTIPREVIASQL